MNIPSLRPGLAVNLATGDGAIEATGDVPMLDQDDDPKADMGSPVRHSTKFTSLQVTNASQAVNHDDSVEDKTIADNTAERRSRESSVASDDSLFGSKDQEFDLEPLIIYEEPVPSPSARKDTDALQGAALDPEQNLGSAASRPYSASPDIAGDPTGSHNVGLVTTAHGGKNKENNEGGVKEAVEEESREATEYPQIGVVWEKNGFQIMPKWTSEPRMESIIAVLRNVISPLKKYDVKHMWNGTYNKFYSVDFDGKQFVMKLTLPVCPRTKTESEVATLKWTNGNTNLAVPKVKHYSSDANNPIGCEWILMTRIKGTPLSQCWRKTTIGSKVRIVVQLAEYAAAVYNKQFRGIGNLYPGPDGSGTPRLGEIASMPFFWHKRSIIDSDRGPFKTTKAWERQRLHLAFAELWDRLRHMEVWPRRYLAWRMLGMCGRCLRLWNLSDDIFTRKLELPTTELGSLQDEAEAEEREDQGRVYIATHESEPEQESGQGTKAKLNQRPKSKPSYGFIIDSDDEEINHKPGPAALVSSTSMVNPVEKLGKDSDAIIIIDDDTDEEDQMSDWERELNMELEQEGLLNRPAKDASQKAFDNYDKFRDGEKEADDLEQQLHRDLRRSLPFHPKESVKTTTESPSNGISDHVHHRGGEVEECENTSSEEDEPAVHDADGKGLATDGDSELLSEPEPEPDPEPEPTMLWHDNISADNIMVDESGILAGVLDWDCVSCLPVASSCDWPALLQDGRHRTEEPEVKDYVDYERGRLRENYWRAHRDFELTYLRFAFAAEMRWRSPGWYETWKGSQMRRDYEAAVQNCDNEFAIGMVEKWCDAVERAIEEGRELKAPEVMSLAGSLTEGLDWTHWDD